MADIKITEKETSALMMGSPNGVQLAFGPAGVWLRDIPRNEWAMKRLQEMRDEAQYLAAAHEHDF